MPLGFPSGIMVKSPPAVQETWVQSLDWKDPLEKEMATRSSILAWKIPWTKKPGWATVHGVTKKSDPTERLKCSTVSIVSSLNSSQRILIRHKLGLDSPLLQMVQ